MSSDDGKLVLIHDVHSYSLGFRCRVSLVCFIAIGVGKASDNPRAAGRAVSMAMTTRLMYSLVLHWTCELASGVQLSRALSPRGPGRRSHGRASRSVFFWMHTSLTRLCAFDRSQSELLTMGRHTNQCVSCNMLIVGNSLGSIEEKSRIPFPWCSFGRLGGACRSV